MNRDKNVKQCHKPERRGQGKQSSRDGPAKAGVVQRGGGGRGEEGNSVGGREKIDEKGGGNSGIGKGNRGSGRGREGKGVLPKNIWKEHMPIDLYNRLYSLLSRI